MAVSRRAFFRTVGIGGAGVLSSSLFTRQELELLAMGQGGGGRRPIADDIIKISSNENPRGPGDAALEAVRGRVTPRVGRYPDNVQELTATVAKLYGGKPENVLMATGSGSELTAAARAYLTGGKALINGSPSYSSTDRYAAEAMKSPVKLVPINAKDLTLDLDAMATAAKGAGLVFLCNPNNPTATTHSAKEIGDFIAKVKASSPSTAIHIDEAYIDYANLPIPTAAPFALQYPDVFITRTFSKAYGMAGLRLGYAFGQPGTLKKLDEAWGLGSVNTLTAAAAIASLNDTAHMVAERAENKRIRDYVVAEFKALGYESSKSQSNFLFVNIKRPAKWFREECEKQKVLVGRDFPPMEKTHARISIGTWEEMHKAMDVFKKVLAMPMSSAAE